MYDIPEGITRGNIQPLEFHGLNDLYTAIYYTVVLKFNTSSQMGVSGYLPTQNTPVKKSRESLLLLAN